jgi:hypothetical protein
METITTQRKTAHFVWVFFFIKITEFFFVDTLCMHKFFTHETAAPQVVLQ